jgi:hypothetical protein
MSTEGTDEDATHEVDGEEPIEVGDLLDDPRTDVEALCLCALLWSATDVAGRVSDLLCSTDFDRGVYGELFEVITGQVRTGAPHDPASIAAGTVRRPDAQDFDTLGGALDEVTRVLANVAISCAVQVAQLPAAGGLSDDSDTHNPAARCAEAADHLHQVAHHLGAANEAAHQFHNAISHITVQEEQ